MELIMDRTESDALLGNEKGVYSFFDMNRVEKAVAEITAEFPSLGIGFMLATKTDWGLPDDFSGEKWPIASQLRRYLDNVVSIKKLFSVAVRLPESMDKLNWESANNIERVLQTAQSRIQGIKQSYHYSGEVFAGEEI